MTFRSRWIGLAALALLAGVSRAAAQVTVNPHGASVGTCTTCHLPNAWRPVRIGADFKHALQTFPLDGAHATAACTTCHTSLDFSKASAQCASCHKDVHRAELGVDCARCHTTRAFSDQARLARVHEATRFPLRGAHSAVACETCHPFTSSGQAQYTGRPTTCVGCHRVAFDRAVSPPHVSAGFSTTCVTCHTETAWRGAPFDHNTTKLPLVGAHATVACATCHADGVFQGRPTTCVLCHQADYDRATNTPPHAAAGFPTTCTTCHTSNTTWKGAPFNHSTTQFPLAGAHAAATCVSCHADRVYKGKPTTCVSCHRPDYDRLTNSPPHAAAGFSTTCTTCHTSNTTWKGAPFNHSTTQFPLTGKHLTVSCASCHADGVFKGKPTTCVSCHRPDFERTTATAHVAAGFSTTCTTCHTSNTSWKGAPFNHSTTQFPLLGAHLTVSCASCHADGVYKGKPTSCVSCHQADYDRPTNSPPHAAAGFSTTCTTCHTSNTTWRGAAFNHSTTQFPLTGAHLTVSCASCHADGVYRGKPTTCVSCHRADYDRTTTPSHTAAGYSTDCTTCHTVNSTWRGAAFNHNTTQFPLTGAHLTVSCASCHADGVYRGKPTSCVSCHRPDYDRTTTPPHVTSGYSTDCATCHTVNNTWHGATFNHTTTQFPLAGAHLTASCASCHADGVYRGKLTTCISCHRPDYERSTNTPPHVAAGFSTTCTPCHTSNTTWVGGQFNHSTTQFPLIGAHLTVSCASCHADGVYRGKPTTCISCHRPDYDRTTTPAHAAAGYSTNCTTCHTGMNSWRGATFNHSTTQFPLTGAHLTATCASCHADGVYRGKPTACVSCHRPDYDRPTNNPPHAAAGFSTICTTCHTTATWQGGSFNHSTTQFPLTGAHLAVSCASCHADGVYRGKPTTCISCHRPDYERSTNTPPHVAAGFSTTCTTCHTSMTTWQGGQFNHSTTVFPLTGAHVTASCASCHADGVYRGKPTACASCHQAAFDATTNPNHRAAFWPNTCASCHTTTRWTGATFDHDGPYFPIYSGAHRGRWTTCAECHTSSSDYRVYTCITCHQQSSTNSHHTGVSGYRYVSTSCYSCHPRGNH